MSAAKEEAALLTPACANIRIVNIEFYEWLALKEKNVPAVISIEKILITNPKCCTANNRQLSIIGSIIPLLCCYYSFIADKSWYCVRG